MVYVDKPGSHFYFPGHILLLGPRPMHNSYRYQEYLFLFGTNNYHFQEIVFFIVDKQQRPLKRTAFLSFIAILILKSFVVNSIIFYLYFCKLLIR